VKRLLKLSLASGVAAAFLTFAASTANAAGLIDTSQLQKAFQTAPSVDKAEVQNAISAIKARNYPAAMTSLGKVAGSTKLTPEQTSAVRNTANQIKSEQVVEAQRLLGGGAWTNKMNQGFKP
jgi:hypothetical protein